MGIVTGWFHLNVNVTSMQISVFDPKVALLPANVEGAEGVVINATGYSF